MTRPCARLVFASIGVTAFVALAVAYWLQHVAGMLPCPYCVLQRYAYAALIVAAAVAWIDRHRATWHGLVVAFIAAAGAGLALWQLSHGASMTSCRVDPVGEFVNTLPPARWWPEYLLAEGSCADRTAVLLGAPIALWSAGLFLVLGIAAAWAAWAASAARAR